MRVQIFEEGQNLDRIEAIELLLRLPVHYHVDLYGLYRHFGLLDVFLDIPINE